MVNPIKEKSFSEHAAAQLTLLSSNNFSFSLIIGLVNSPYIIVFPSPLRGGIKGGGKQMSKK